VAINIPQTPIQKAKTFQQNVRFVLATIQRIIEVVLFSRTFKITKTAILLKQIKIISTKTSDTKKIIIVYKPTPVIILPQKIQKYPHLTYHTLKQLKTKTQIH